DGRLGQGRRRRLEKPRRRAGRDGQRPARVRARARRRARFRLPNGRRKDSPRAAPLQRPHGDARQHQRQRTEAARRPRFAAGVCRAVPLYHIFGSEELSSWAPAVRELVPKPYVALNPEDAQALGLAEGQIVRVAVATSSPPGQSKDGKEFSLALKLASGLASG